MAAVDRFRVVGGARLVGEVSVSGAKNSALKLMAASLLAAGKTTIRNVPDIADVDIMADLLTRLGCTVERGTDLVTIDVPEVPGHRADYARNRFAVCILRIQTGLVENPNMTKRVTDFGSALRIHRS
jgi:UDP-N-acetylglucosamine enolpyruvyl transferase